MTSKLSKSQILLYEIIKRLGGVDDKVKLAKFAYFADFIHYAFHDESISGANTLYQKQKFGPLAVNFNSDLRHLIEEGFISNPQKYNYKVAKNIETGLSKSEIKTIDFVLSKYKEVPFDVLADISHRQIPYMTASSGGVISYDTAYNLVDEYPDYATV
jgi:uncharacterized protein YwgA